MNPINLQKHLSRFGADVEFISEEKPNERYHYFEFRYDNEAALTQALIRMRLDGIEAHPAIQNGRGVCVFFN